MALLGRFIALTQDTSGNSSVGASVTVLKQGAQVKGTQAGPAYTVDDCGGIVVGDVVYAASAPGTQRAVTAVSATSVTTGAPGLGTLSDDDRILIASALPTLYLDAAGTDTTANPLTSDASGVASCWIEGGFYDADFSGGSPSLTRAFQYDIYVSGYDTRSAIYNSGTAVAFKFDTLRALGAADKILQVSNQESTEAFSIGGTGNAAVAGTLAVTGASTLTGAVTVTVGLTATTGNLQATAGDVKVRRAVATQGTALVNGDFGSLTNWGAGSSVSVSANSYDTRGRFSVTAAGVPGANASLVLTFKDGAFAVVPRCVCNRTDATAPTTGFWTTSPGTTGVTFLFVGTPVAGSVYPCDYIVIG